MDPSWPPINGETPLENLSVEHGKRPTAPDLGPNPKGPSGNGRFLAQIHRMHLADMQRIHMLMDRIEQGMEDPGTLPAALQAMPMTENMARFGTVCGRECRVLTGHHDAEQHMMFPQLANLGNSGIKAVVERLLQEHEVVHELLQRLQVAADALVQAPSEQTFSSVRAHFNQLYAVVKSHFGYEEAELEQALDRLELPI